MNRLGLFTGSGVVGAVLVPLLVAVAALATHGGIFSSGPLNAHQAQAPIGGAMSHADLACSQCHTPFWSEQKMGDRCVACHTDVAEELVTPGSLHAASAATTANCRTCHPEHKGSNTSLTVYAPNLYPHAEFGYYLIGHLSHADGRPFTCADCHVDTTQAFTQDTCLDCHQKLDASWMATHALDFGTNCLACHDGIDTYGKGFDHQATAFPLFDKHADLSCASCHAGASTLADLQAAPTACVACHAADDAHQGRLGTDCAACHTAAGWTTTQFDHSTTGFPLVGGHSGVACETCHVGGQLSGVSNQCIDCHASDDAHAGKLGTDCAKCHTAENWTTIIDGSFDHAMSGFPLTGAHARVPSCTDCHAGGRFVDTPTACVACHAKDDAHKGAFGKNCSSCHTTTAWKPATFDHAQTGFKLTGGHANVACVRCHPGNQYQGTSNSCTACHTGDKPANHYSGQCSQCHTTTAWKPATFNHSGQTDCASCHTKDKPANHYSGQCSQCHTTKAWQPATFNHSGLTDCASCHTKDKPANHYNGQCSQCHNTGAWTPAKFNHNGLTDCASCHTKDKPANHYSGQCSQCHTTTAWKPATFNHSGLTDCASCHTKDKPANHYSGQCSQCHTTTAWKPATFNHSGLTDCASCHTKDKPDNHYSGQCSQCHTTTAWQPATFDHSGLTDCASCHTKDKPDNHYSGQCSQCHSTTAWQPATFNHPSSPLALTGEHAVPPRSCSDCHTSSNYSSVPTTCDGCHHSTYTGVTDPNHQAAGMSAFAAANCSNCHASSKSSWSGPNWTHMRITNPQRVSLPHEHASCADCHQTSNDYTVTSCAGSGCHRSAGGPD